MLDAWNLLEKHFHMTNTHAISLAVGFLTANEIVYSSYENAFSAGSRHTTVCIQAIVLNFYAGIHQSYYYYYSMKYSRRGFFNTYLQNE